MHMTLFPNDRKSFGATVESVPPDAPESHPWPCLKLGWADAGGREHELALYNLAEDEAREMLVALAEGFPHVLSEMSRAAGEETPQFLGPE